MPIDRLERAKATLPDGYQFGDSAPSGVAFMSVGDVRRCANNLSDAIDRHIAEDVYGRRLSRSDTTANADPDGLTREQKYRAVGISHLLDSREGDHTQSVDDVD
jgi:hypothetical protein